MRSQRSYRAGGWNTHLSKKYWVRPWPLSARARCRDRGTRAHACGRSRSGYRSLWLLLVTSRVAASYGVHVLVHLPVEQELNFTRPGRKGTANSLPPLSHSPVVQDVILGFIRLVARKLAGLLATFHYLQTDICSEIMIFPLYTYIHIYSI